MKMRQKQSVTNPKHHGCCWCLWCDIFGQCDGITEAYTKRRKQMRQHVKENINESIKYEEFYGKLLTLWIYSIPRKEWVTVETIMPGGFNSVPYDITNQTFMRGTKEWLYLGAFWFPADVNPNYEKVLAPVYLPPEFLAQYNIVQENLQEKSPEDAFMASRDLTGTNHIDRAKAKVAEAKTAAKAAAKTPLDKAIEDLQNDWQSLSKYPPFVLDSISKKGYKLERTESQVRIVASGEASSG